MKIIRLSTQQIAEAASQAAERCRTTDATVAFVEFADGEAAYIFITGREHVQRALAVLTKDAQTNGGHFRDTTH